MYNVSTVNFILKGKLQQATSNFYSSNGDRLLNLISSISFPMENLPLTPRIISRTDLFLLALKRIDSRVETNSPTTH